MADDLVQRARAAAETSIKPHAKHMFPQGTRHHVYGSEMRELLHALADALARKDAEIAELRKTAARLNVANNGLLHQHATDSMTLRNLCAERDTLRQRAERAEARVREAPVYQIPATKPSTRGGWARVIRSVKYLDAIRGKRVALVLLDTEEAK